MGLIAWRNIVCHKGRSAFLGLCVVLGVAFVAGTFVLTDTIKRVFTQVFDQAYEGTAVNVRSASDLGAMTTRTPLPASLLAKVESVPGVRAAEGDVFVIGGRIFDSNGKAAGSAFAPTFLASWQTNADLNTFHIVEGLAPRGPNEVVIDMQAASKAKLTIGDQVRVQTTKGIQKFRLVGVAKYGSAGNLAGASAVLFDLATAQEQANRIDQFDSIAVAANKGITDSTLQDRIQAVIGAKYEAVTGTELSVENSDSISSGLSFFTTFLLVFAAVSLFVGAFIVYNTFAIVVAQRTREMALLRALGADSEQVIGSIIVESVVIGVIASAFGLLGGVGLAIGLRGLLSALGISIPSGPMTILPRTIIVSMLGGVVMTVVSAIAPAIKASRVPPLAAVRSVTMSTVTQRRTKLTAGAVLALFGFAATAFAASSVNLPLLGVGAVGTVLGVALLAPSIVPPFVHVLATPIRSLRGVAGQLAEENATRGAQRTATTAAALMIGTALIAASLVLAASINTSTDEILGQGVRAELIVSADRVSGIGPTVTDAIRATDGVAAVASYRYGSFKIGNATKVVVAMDGAALTATNPESSLDLGVSSGSFTALDDGGVAVSKKVADDRNWKIGDIVPMVFATGKSPQRIVATFKTTAFGEYIISLRTHEKVFSDSIDQLAFVRIKKDAPIAALKTRIATLLKTEAPTSKVQDRKEYGAQIRAQVSQILNLITALVLLAIIIALMGVLITMLLSVLERTHELGLLRAVGMDRRDVRSMVRWEAAIISTFGAALGVALGIGLGYALTRTLRDQGITTLELPYRSLIIMILAVTVAGVGASIYPARRASRLNVLRAIASD